MIHFHSAKGPFCFVSFCFETESYYVAQTGLQFLGSSDTLASISMVAGTTGVCYGIRLSKGFLCLDILFYILHGHSLNYFALTTSICPLLPLFPFYFLLEKTKQKPTLVMD